MFALVAAGCIAVPEGKGVPRPISAQAQDDAGLDSFVPVDPLEAGDARSELPATDPHALIGIDPSHGRFSGGTRAVIRGRGFDSTTRLWFGSTEVPSRDVVADFDKLQVVVPAGEPGLVDVRVQNGNDESTSRVLVSGYRYDALYVEPSSAPTTGGTEIDIYGSGTAWSSSTTVRIGNEPCLALSVVSPTQLECRVPPHQPGTVTVRVGNGTDWIEVADAFTYADSDNGFKGGLSGGALDGVLKVAVYNDYTGMPVPGAQVVAGTLQASTDAAGIALLTDDSLTGKRSVTIAKHCFKATTFLDVPVDTVTAYLAPVMSPDCGSADAGDIPPVGGRTSNPATIKGQLVWPMTGEFQRGHWSNVPPPASEQERQVAYVYTPHWDPTAKFQPDPSRTVLPDAPGTIGYEFSMSSGGGNLTLYALAGIENTQTRQFTAYALGLVRGVTAVPGQTTADVLIRMDKQLDQALVLRAQPPSPGPRGPDRLLAGVSVRLGNDGYVILPAGWRSLPLADTGDVTFVGLPGLDGMLDPSEGVRFVSWARAVTGASYGAPLSVVGKFVTTDATVPVDIGSFVPVPVLKVPGPTERFDGRHLEIEYAPGGTFVDLTVIRIQAGGGLMEWLVTAPANKRSIELPDLGSMGATLPSGPVTISVYGANVDEAGFDYGTLQYRHLGSSGWLAYSQDVFNGYH